MLLATGMWRIVSACPLAMAHLRAVMCTGVANARILKLHTFQFPVQRLALDAEDLCGLALVAAGRGENAADLVLLRLGERFDGPVARFHRGEGVVDAFAVDAVGQ